jgi:uroporphyrinogen decarboxylase
MERAAQSLGLSVIGVELGTECSDSLLSERSYRKLEQYFTVGCLNGPISGLIEDYGFFNAMTSTKRDPSLLSGIVTKLLRETEKKAKSAHDNGFRAIAITDDIAGNKGIFFSPHYFVDVLWPVYREIAEIVKGAGLFAFFHSDGDMRKVIGRLIEAGYDCIHPVDTQAGLNLYELKQQFGERVSFMGQIDIMTLGEEPIRKEIDLAENEFKKGGLIIGSTCGISMKTLNHGDSKLGALHPQWTRREQPM